MTEITMQLMTWIKLNWVLILILAVLAGAFLFLRSTPSDVDSANELSSLLQDGQPTVIEFYSNF